MSILLSLWGDVDFERNRVFIKKAVTSVTEFDENGEIIGHSSVVDKTRTDASIREIGLTVDAKTMLLKWRAEAPKVSKTQLGKDDYIFGSEMKSSFTYSNFRQNVNRYLDRQSDSTDSIRLHRCRHTVATLLVAEGREVEQIKKQLGITKEETLGKYIDKQGNNKIIAGNTEAISNGLHGLIEKKADSSDQQLIDEIMEEVESMEDSKTKMMLQALLGMVQKK